MTLFSESLLFFLLDLEEGGSSLTVGNGLLVEQNLQIPLHCGRGFFLFVLLEKKLFTLGNQNTLICLLKISNDSDFERMKDHGKF